MLYFAYGSNMDWTRIKGRCPSAGFLGTASLPDYELAFTRKCRAQHGVADIRSSEGKTVWGVIYKLDEGDLGSLDDCEGYKPQRKINAYRRIEIQVLADGKPEKPMTTWTYEVVLKSDSHVPPSRKYLDYILQGAMKWHLPEDYIQQLRQIEVQI